MAEVQSHSIALPLACAADFQQACFAASPKLQEGVTTDTGRKSPITIVTTNSFPIIARWLVTGKADLVVTMILGDSLPGIGCRPNYNGMHTTIGPALTYTTWCCADGDFW